MSASAAAALVDVFAEAINARRLYGIVTTHSSDVIARVPIAHIRLVHLDSGLHEFVIRKPRSCGEVEFVLGQSVGQGRVALVEDAVAAMVAAELLGRFAAPWGRSIEILACGGAAEVLLLCDKFPAAPRLRVVGVLDGDQALPTDTKWPVIALPGAASPEDFLRSAVEADVEEFAARVSRDTVQIRTLLGTLGGRDPHDWLIETARSLELDIAAVIRASLDCWLRQPENLVIGRAFVAAVVDSLTA